jgi:hypothetical protein
LVGPSDRAQRYDDQCSVIYINKRTQNINSINQSIARLAFYYESYGAKTQISLMDLRSVCSWNNFAERSQFGSNLGPTEKWVYAVKKDEPNISGMQAMQIRICAGILVVFSFRFCSPGWSSTP